MLHRKFPTDRGPPAIGVTTLRERSLAPDLTRGAMLLLIALANGSVSLLAPALLLGVWAARRRLLDEPERHRRLLWRTAALGLGLAAAGGLPWALVKAHWWQPPSAAADAVAGMAHTLTGYAGGVGYAAVAGLVAIRVRGRPGRSVTALVAWVLTVLLAEFMRRRGYRGPAEVLLRRLTYRPVSSPGAPPGG